MATMRISSQVWPIWLPRAVARSEQRIVKKALPKQLLPLPQILFSASFQSLLSNSPESSPTSGTLKATSRIPNLNPRQQTRTFSSSPIRRFSNSPISPPPIASSHDSSSLPTWTPPTSPHTRPVTILGAGVLGRRLATLWASTGRPVNLYDTSPLALTSATTFIADTLSSYCAEQGTHPGRVRFTTSLHKAVENAWMVIEAVPEEMELKISALGRVERILPRDTILATNSASFRSGELVSEVRNRERVLNTLYYIPPKNRCVELMSCGYTSPALIPFLVSQMREMGLRPMVVGNESTGLIFPRIFAAMKREALKVLEQGIAKPEEIDELFKDFFGAEKGICGKMDEVGLDTVAKTERHFLAGEMGEEEEEDGEELRRVPEYLRWLEREFVEKGKLGEKSGEGLIVEKVPVVKGNSRHETPGQEVWKEHSVDLSGM